MFWRRREVYRAKVLERLSSPDDLEDTIQIVDPKDWVAIVVLIALIALAAIWAVLGHITTTRTIPGVIVPAPHDDRRTVVAYVPARDGRILRAGMPASLLTDATDAGPRTASAGVISSTSPVLVTFEQAVARAGQADAARAVLDACPCLEVATTLAPDLESQAGGAGATSSSSGAAAAGLAAGERVTLRVIVDRRRPLAYLLPLLRGSGRVEQP